jgi:hypothetical protein
MTLAIDQSSVSLTRRGRGSHCLSEVVDSKDGSALWTEGGSSESTPTGPVSGPL